MDGVTIDRRDHSILKI